MDFFYEFCLLYFSWIFFPTTLYTCSSLSGRFSSHSPINIIAVASCNYLFRPPRILDCVHKMAPPPGPTSSSLCQQCYGLMQKSTMKREITTMSKLSSLSSRIQGFQSRSHFYLLLLLFKRERVLCGGINDEKHYSPFEDHNTIYTTQSSTTISLPCHTVRNLHFLSKNSSIFWG